MNSEDNGSSRCPEEPTIKDLPKHRGRGDKLIPLKTTLETRARESLINVYITSVPVKQASGTLDIIRKLIPNDGGLDLQHLRRFAKYDNLPEHVLSAFSALRTQPAVEGEAGTELFLIIGSTNVIPSQTIIETLSPLVKNLHLCTIQIPLLAPTSQEQASLWTKTYWPTVYKKSNPFGPHPSIVARAEEGLVGEVGNYMDLANEVACETLKEGFGERVGVVVVERKGGVGRVVAVAGDARWKDWPYGDGERGAGGNVTAHAALRAIGMVAEGLRTRESNQVQTQGPIPSAQEEIFQDKPNLPLEMQHYDTSGNENSYLCHELEIYCSHEPCVMCSMAIVHSRFGRLVFGKRMKETGGVCADEDGLGHGLWWRKELNWTMLAWQFVREGEDGDEVIVGEDLNA